MSIETSYEAIRHLEEFIPLRENLKLEFKAGRVMAGDRRILPRAVCAMLNSEGGTVVVGIGEEHGLPRLDPLVGVGFEEVRVRVRDRMISLLDPPAELSIRELACRTGFGVAIDVPKSDRLHAVRGEGGSFAFYSRVADRVVPLDLGEIRARLGVSEREGAANSREAEIESELSNWIQRARKDAVRAPEYAGGLFIYLRCRTERLPWKRALDILSPSVLEPERIGVRRAGWHYGAGIVPSQSATDQDWLTAGDPRSMYRHLEWSRDGCLRFATTLFPEILRPQATTNDRILAVSDSDESFPEWEPHPSGLSYRPIWPKPLIETVASCCRLHAKLLDEVSSAGFRILDTEASGGLVLSGVESTQLGREWIGSEDRNPSHAAHDHLHVFEETPSLVSSMDLGAYRSTPDRLAFELITHLYHEFGLERGDVPFFTESTGEFQLG